MKNKEILKKLKDFENFYKIEFNLSIFDQDSNYSILDSEKRNDGYDFKLCKSTIHNTSFLASDVYLKITELNFKLQ